MYNRVTSVLLSALHGLFCVNNKPFGDERDIPADILWPITLDEEDGLLSEINGNLLSESIDEALSRLKAKESRVLRMRYGFFGKEMTLEEIGQEYEVSRERIRQIEALALRKLRSPHYRKYFTDFIG